MGLRVTERHNRGDVLRLGPFCTFLLLHKWLQLMLGDRDLVFLLSKSCLEVVVISE